MKHRHLLGALCCALITTAAQAADKPNVLIIWGDDIGISNISYHTRGLMGYQTPNIDRIAHEGLAFNNYYGQQSCTAGRAAFIGGSVPLRSGMTKETEAKFGPYVAERKPLVKNFTSSMASITNRRSPSDSDVETKVVADPLDPPAPKPPISPVHRWTSIDSSTSMMKPPPGT